jgi:alpha-beta hydrolase superfamily lysophospholipase
MSLEDDVAYTKRALAAKDGPAILVGHSYGGAVITVYFHSVTTPLSHCILNNPVLALKHVVAGWIRTRAGGSRIETQR